MAGRGDRACPAASCALSKEVVARGRPRAVRLWACPVGEAHVLGRDGELKVLTRLARGAASGRGRLVLIEGEDDVC